MDIVKILFDLMDALHVKTYKEFSSVVGCSLSAMKKWCSGQAIPTGDIALRIYNLCIENDII